MTTPDQIQAFYNDLWKVVCRYRGEFELPAAAGVGVLEMVKLRLYKEHIEGMEEDDDDDDDEFRH